MKKKHLKYRVSGITLKMEEISHFECLGNLANGEL